jgi:hypothetical protein
MKQPNIKQYLKLSEHRNNGTCNLLIEKETKNQDKRAGPAKRRASAFVCVTTVQFTFCPCCMIRWYQSVCVRADDNWAISP